MGIYWTRSWHLGKSSKIFCKKYIDSVKQNLNEVRGQAMLMGEEYSDSCAKALGFVQATV